MTIANWVPTTDLLPPVGRVVWIAVDPHETWAFRRWDRPLYAQRALYMGDDDDGQPIWVEDDPDLCYRLHECRIYFWRHVDPKPTPPVRPDWWNQAKVTA